VIVRKIRQACLQHTVPAPLPGVVAVRVMGVELFETILVGLLVAQDCSAVWQWDVVHLTPRLRLHQYEMRVSSRLSPMSTKPWTRGGTYVIQQTGRASCFRQCELVQPYV